MKYSGYFGRDSLIAADIIILMYFTLSSTYLPVLMLQRQNWDWVIPNINT